MKRHITPYLLIFILILILSGGTYYITQKYTSTNTPGTASVYTATPIRTIIAKPVSTDTTYAIGLMNGSCVVVVLNSNGYPNSSLSYAGHFNASYDCVRTLSNTGNTATLLNLSGTSITTSSSTAYFRDTATLAILEAKLITLGTLDQKEPSGTFTLATFNAIKKLQSKNSIPATGYLDAATLKILDRVPFSKKMLGGKNITQITIPQK